MQPSDPNLDHATPPSNRESTLMRTLLWIGVAGVAAGVAFAVARTLIVAAQPPDDPTSRRIQQLIDEANALLKTLDEQKHSA